MKIGAITIQAAREHFEVFSKGKHVANLYRIAEGFGKGSIKEGEWVINRGPFAIDKGLRFPEVSYSKVVVALAVIKSIDLPA